MSRKSREIVLGIGLVGLILEAIAAHPALAVDKIKLFKVTTPRGEIVVGLTSEDLGRIDGRDANALSRAVQGNGSLEVWQYAPRTVSGEVKQAPLQQIALLAGTTLRVERYKSPIKVIPINEIRMRPGPPPPLKEVPSRGT